MTVLDLYERIEGMIEIPNRKAQKELNRFMRTILCMLSPKSHEILDSFIMKRCIER